MIYIYLLVMWALIGIIWLIPVILLKGSILLNNIKLETIEEPNGIVYQGVYNLIAFQIFGHEDEKTTRIYLDSFVIDMMKEAFKKL